MKFTDDLEEKIGTPQIFHRTVTMDGLEILIRLQKVFEEKPEMVQLFFKLDHNMNIITEGSYSSDQIYYGSALLFECWSNATKTLVTLCINKGDKESEEEFLFTARYMLNHASDEEWIDTMRKEGFDQAFSLTCNDAGLGYVEPTVKDKK